MKAKGRSLRAIDAEDNGLGWRSPLDVETAPNAYRAMMGSGVTATDVWELILLADRHPGLTEGRASSLCESARVCLRAHHTSPTKLSIHAQERGGVDAEDSEHVLAWMEPTQREHNVNLNRRDAARDGAYAVALLCLERKLGLVALGQSRDLSGADWIVAPQVRASPRREVRTWMTRL